MEDPGQESRVPVSTTWTHAGLMCQEKVDCPAINKLVNTVLKLIENGQVWERVQGSLVRILAIHKAKKRSPKVDLQSVALVEPSASLLQIAENLMFRVASLEVSPEIVSFRALDLVFEKYIWVVRGRLGEKGLFRLIGKYRLSLLLKISHGARLQMKKSHKKNHDSVEKTLVERWKCLDSAGKIPSKVHCP